MPSKVSSHGSKLTSAVSKSLRLQLGGPCSVIVSETGKKYWSFGNILSQGGFGLIYLGIILPMYVLLKLVELGPCDVTFIVGSVSVMYIVLSSMFSVWYTQASK